MGLSEHNIYLRRVDPARNMARYYALWLQPTLFDEVSLVREWGRIGTRGRSKMEVFGTSAEAIERRDWMARTKRRRGYVDLLLSRHQPSSS